MSGLTMTVGAMRAMIGAMHTRRQQRRAQCAADGHVWNDWVELPPDREGRACARCAQIQIVRFFGEEAS